MVDDTVLVCFKEKKGLPFNFWRIHIPEWWPIFINYNTCMAVRSPKLCMPLMPFAQGSLDHQTCLHMVCLPLFYLWRINHGNGESVDILDAIVLNLGLLCIHGLHISMSYIIRITEHYRNVFRVSSCFKRTRGD